MTTWYEIPLQSPPQSFNISLGNTVYTMLVIWNVQMQSWILDIGNSAGTPIAQGLPIQPGADIVGQLAYLGFGGMIITSCDFDPYANPTYENLGQDGGCQLFYATTP